MPYKDKFIRRDYSRGYMRNYRASKKGLTVKPVKPNLLNLVNPTIVKPCSLCPNLKKQIENLKQQIQSLTAEKNNLLTAKETIQKQLTELEKNQVKKASERKIKEPKKVAVRQPQNQPVKVDWAELEKETGLKKD